MGDMASVSLIGLLIVCFGVVAVFAIVNDSNNKWKSKYNDLYTKIPKLEALAQQAQAEARKRHYTTLQHYSDDNVDYINTIVSIGNKKEFRWLLNNLKKRIYEVAVMADTEPKIINAVGKAKGIYLLELELDRIDQINRGDDDIPEKQI